jgi:hypothetical protein
LQEAACGGAARASGVAYVKLEGKERNEDAHPHDQFRLIRPRSVPPDSPFLFLLGLGLALVWFFTFGLWFFGNP